jgi:hypothetical protein
MHPCPKTKTFVCLAAFYSLFISWPSSADALKLKVHTYADLEAEITRNAERYNDSLLTSGEKRDFDDTELISSLFYQLPLPERVVYVIASFAQASLDGEKADVMYLFLTHQYYPHTQTDPVPPRTKEDVVYTRSIFNKIHSYDKDQLQAFSSRLGNYARFQKNLQIWEKRCNSNG